MCWILLAGVLVRDPRRRLFSFVNASVLGNLDEKNTRIFYGRYIAWGSILTFEGHFGYLSDKKIVGILFSLILLYCTFLGCSPTMGLLKA